MDTILNPPVPRLALVGDRSASIRAHARIPTLLASLRRHDHLDLDAYWIPTTEVTAEDSLAGFDGIWLVPGSPYANEAGAVTAVRTARERGVPLLGTCGGFQHAILEFARNVCGMRTVQHAENTPDGEDLLIVALECSLVGHEKTVRLTPGSLAETALGTDRTVERYHCAYGPASRYLDVLRAHGMAFTGIDDEGEVRVAELPGHPFYLVSLFQPELAGDGTRPHPIIRAFATAVAAHAGSVLAHSA